MLPKLVELKLDTVTLKEEPDDRENLERLCRFYNRFGFEEQGKRTDTSVDMLKRFDTRKR